MEIRRNEKNNERFSFEEVMNTLCSGDLVEDEKGRIFIVTDEDTLIDLDSGYVRTHSDLMLKDVTRAFFLQEK